MPSLAHAFRLAAVGTSLLFLAACHTAAPQPPPAPPPAVNQGCQEIAAQVTKALDAYWAKTPDQGALPPLRLVYFVASDRDPLPRYQERITGWFDDFQEFFRSEFARNGYAPRDLLLERNPDHTVKLHLVKGQKKDAEYTYKSGGEICQEVRKALRGTVDFDRETVLIINALSKTEDGKIKLYAPYYGLGLGNQMKGTALVVDQELLEIPSLGSMDQKVTIAEHRDRTMTLGEYNTTYIGGTLHELGHALTLPHDYQTGDERGRGVPLMGAGNYTYRNDRRGKAPVTYLSFSEATRLVSQPLFSHRSCERETSPKIDGGDVRLIPETGRLLFHAKLESKIPVYAAIVYIDKEGNDDYDSLSFVAVPDANGQIDLAIPRIPKGDGQVRAVCCHVNGAISLYSQYYKNPGDGTPITFTSQAPASGPKVRAAIQVKKPAAAAPAQKP